jgi:hypothetical protein
MKRARPALDATNIRAIQSIYAAAMLEELKLFQVADRLVELFQSGALPIARGVAGQQLYRYAKTSRDRLTAADRRTLYARTLGIGGHQTGARPNRDFGDLWMRFLTSVAALARQASVTDLLRLAEDVHSAGRDLAANLSGHGDGLTYYAARELNAQIELITELLSTPEIRSVYGARDLWQVVDKLAALELGGASNSTRHRTMATAGSTIIGWLARRARDLARPSRLVLKVPVSARPSGRGGARPRDADLVAACEQWLSVAVVDGERSPAHSSGDPTWSPRPVTQQPTV